MERTRIRRRTLLRSTSPLPTMDIREAEFHQEEKAKRSEEQDNDWCDVRHASDLMGALSAWTSPGRSRQPAD